MTLLCENGATAYQGDRISPEVNSLRTGRVSLCIHVPDITVTRVPGLATIIMTLEHIAYNGMKISI
jgi:hypothetical protein